MSDNTLVVSDAVLPSALKILPLTAAPVFPGIFTPLMIDAPEDVKIIEESCDKDGFIGIVLLKNQNENPTV